MFDTSVTVLRVWGIPIRLHITLLLFLPYVAFAASYQFGVIAQALDIPPESIRFPNLVWGGILAIGLFVAVLLHELAHCVVALHSGAKIRAITLMMLGGVTQMEEDVRPEREAWMAFAGPLASFGIGLVAYLFYRVVPLSPGLTVAVYLFAVMNAILGVFNLLPAFPMDGGRVLRGLLIGRVGQARATRIATSVGKIMAAVFALFGVLSFNVLLILIAGFVYMGAAAERSRYEAHDILKGMTVMQFMTDRLGEAHPGESVAEVARRLLAHNLAGARVVTEEPDGHEHTMGIVTADELAASAARAGEVPVENAIHEFPKVHSDDEATKTLDALSRAGTSAVVVLDARDEIIGLVTESDVRRALALAAIGPGRSFGG